MALKTFARDAIAMPFGQIYVSRPPDVRFNPSKVRRTFRQVHQTRISIICVPRDN